MIEQVETVIIGGGHSGLTMSYYLSQLGREHVILERARVAERWRSERWDSFFFQFPNWTIKLPGYKYQCDNPDGFAPGKEIIQFIENYAALNRAPVRCGVRVTLFQESPKAGRYLVQAGDITIETANVVLATGGHQEAAIPKTSAGFSSKVFQVHSNRYRNHDQLPPGAVLVVGSGSSGCQIAEDLNWSGRKVYLSVGRHRRVPRQHRGKDFSWWNHARGVLDTTVDMLPSPAAKFAPLPVVTGVKGGYDINLRRMAADGITLMGYLRGISDGMLSFAPDLQQKLAEGDQFFVNYKKSIDDYIMKNGIDAPPDESGAKDDVRDAKEVSDPILELDLKAAGITSVVWSSGFRYDFGWVKLPLFDGTGEPIHRRGVTGYPGVYFLGLKWLYKLKSAFLSGMAEDAEYLADQIENRK